MSRIGKKPVAIPSGVTVSVAGDIVSIKGPKGELKLTLLPEVTVKVEEGKIVVTRADNERKSLARHGLTRMLLANMTEGVSKGFVKKLEIIGVGYRAQAKGKSVSLQLGYSHPIEYKCPPGIEVEQDPENKQVLVVKGIDKEVVGQVAADIRSYRPPEPYKGKGIKYIDERILRKVGKAAAKTTA